MSVNACLQHLALKPTIFAARQPHKIYCCHVQVTEEVPVSPSAEAVIVAVLWLPAQVKISRNGGGVLYLAGDCHTTIARRPLNARWCHVVLVESQSTQRFGKFQMWCS